MLGEDDGLELVRRLRAEPADLVIVVASARSDTSTLAAVAAAGGNGFAPKRGAFSELVSILRAARAGLDVGRAVAAADAATPPITARWPSGSPRASPRCCALMGGAPRSSAIAGCSTSR